MVYTWRGADALAEAIAGAVYRAHELELVALDPDFLDAVAATLDRTNRWQLAVTGRVLYLTIGGGVHESEARRVAIPAAD